ncbi:MAG TPA: xylulokinase [Chloroflexota bacterium]|nr:xylulokinase [Chloroflexota bacterium]
MVAEQAPAALLGIDVGTTGARALLVSPAGALVAASSVDYPMATPAPGWAEQDPSDWVSATKRAVQDALSAAGHPTVLAVGLTGQMHGLVLLDDQGAVLRPAILWCDQRTTAQCRRITEIVGAERLIRLTCNPALEGFTAPKLLWVREHEPATYARIRQILLPKDYLRYVLTGDYATDVSDASGTLLLDVRHRRWSAEMLAALDVPRVWLPELVESPVITGHVLPEPAAEFGIPAGTPVVGGGGDQAAGGVGNGVVRPGIVSSTIGSSGVVFAHSAKITLDPGGRVHTFCHAVPGAWHVMGVTQGAGLSLRWWREQFAAAETSTAQRLHSDPYIFLTAEAATVAAGADGLHWLPYLMGERTPHLDANARGVLYGITARHTRAHVLRAVMEGVVYSLCDSLELLREMAVPVSEVRASGGGARSALWRQMQADVFHTPVVTVQAQEGPAYGAALLAAVGHGLYPTVPAACDAWIRLENRAEPSPANVAVYAAQYPIYRALYPALKPLFQRSGTAGVEEMKG